MLSFLKPPISPFETPSTTYLILHSPLKYIARKLFRFILLLRGPALPTPPEISRIRIVAISDTHTQKATCLPAGDVLIHAGDLANAGTVTEIQEQIDWLSSLPYDHKIVIAGNHDSYLDPRSRPREDEGRRLEWKDVTYLQHSTLKLFFSKQGNRELRFYGAPQIPQCGGKDFAFQYHRNDDAWTGTIPLETDVLITHTPPRYHLDLPAGLGCDYLLKEAWRVKPRVHVFGHVHADYGRENVFWDEGQASYERICRREAKGVLSDFIAISAWLDMAKLIAYGAVGILWSRIWGGDVDGSIMVNAALTYKSTGQLRNAPQVIDI